MTNSAIISCEACGEAVDSIYNPHRCAADMLRERGAALAQQAREDGKDVIAVMIRVIQSAADGEDPEGPQRTMATTGGELRWRAANWPGVWGSRAGAWVNAMAAPFGVIIGEPCSAGLADGATCGEAAAVFNSAGRYVCSDHSGKWNTCYDCGVATSHSYGMRARKNAPHRWRCAACNARVEREREQAEAVAV